MQVLNMKDKQNVIRWNEYWRLSFFESFPLEFYTLEWQLPLIGLFFQFKSFVSRIWVMYWTANLQILNVWGQKRTFRFENIKFKT